MGNPPNEGNRRSETFPNPGTKAIGEEESGRSLERAQSTSEIVGNTRNGGNLTRGFSPKTFLDPCPRRNTPPILFLDPCDHGHTPPFLCLDPCDRGHTPPFLLLDPCDGRHTPPKMCLETILAPDCLHFWV